MDRLQLREAEIFQALKKLSKLDLVLIGGYAANSYALPRFSVDCDIVIRKKDAGKIKEVLIKEGYGTAGESHDAYEGKFLRFEKRIEKDIVVSVDVLVDSVHDRQSGVSFDAGWIFKNSARRTITGKTISERVETRIINADALFVMKFISARATDIRDIFMMVNSLSDPEWIRMEIGRRVDFQASHRKIMEKIKGEQFKDNLQGVYGYIDEKLFQKHVKILADLNNV